MEKYGISFKEMNKKQKVKHIWEYYRYAILSGIIATGVIISLGKTVFFPAPENVVEAMVSGLVYADAEGQEELESLSEEYRVGVQVVPVDFEGDNLGAGTIMQKITLMMSAHSLEILAIPEDIFDRFAKIHGEDMFMPLENEQELTSLLNTYQSQLYVCDKGLDKEGNELDTAPHVYGIKVSNLKGLPEVDQREELVVGLIAMPRDKEKTIELYKYLVSGEQDKTSEPQ